MSAPLMCPDAAAVPLLHERAPAAASPQEG